VGRYRTHAAMGVALKTEDGVNALKPYAALFRFLIGWLAFAALSAHAFDEDGYRTEMSVNEVKEALPKDRVLVRAWPDYEWYFVLYRDKNRRTPTSIAYAVYFVFCKGLLMSYTKPIDPDTAYLPKMKALLERFGHPSSIKVLDGSFDKLGPALQVMWWAKPDRIAITLSPATPATKKEKASPAIASVTFSTPNPECGDFDVPARRPWQLPPPFGTIG